MLEHFSTAIALLQVLTHVATDTSYTLHMPKSVCTVGTLHVFDQELRDSPWRLQSMRLLQVSPWTWPIPMLLVPPKTCIIAIVNCL